MNQLIIITNVRVKNKNKLNAFFVTILALSFGEGWGEAQKMCESCNEYQ
jgi:hypothetical protein